jgi:hypothetical protein
MLLVYDLTVLVATYIRAAISRFDRPAAINPKPLGEIADQAALHGALNKIRNLNLALISVIKVDSAAVEPIPQTDQSPPSARSWHAAGREPDVSPQALSTRRILRACLSDQLVSHTFGLFFACGPLIRRCAAWESRLARADSQQWRCEPAIGIAGRCSLRR